MCSLKLELLMDRTERSVFQFLLKFAFVLFALAFYHSVQMSKKDHPNSSNENTTALETSKNYNPVRLEAVMEKTCENMKTTHAGEFFSPETGLHRQHVAKCLTTLNT